MNQIYLDYAAATPLDTKVRRAMEPFFNDQFFNPSAMYLAAREVHQTLAAARSAVAAVLGARPAEIIFTAGGTEANNLLIHGIMAQYPGKKILVSSIEHESVLVPAHHYNCHEIAVRPDGIVEVAALERLIDDDTVLVCVMYANNEVGSVQPLREVAACLQTVRTKRRASGNTLPLYFHTDAAQAANYLDLHVSRLGVDSMTLNGGKLYGPKQSGALWLRGTLSLEPLIFGGGQERGLRSGTENVAAIVGFSTALQLAQTLRATETRRLKSLQQLFLDQVTAGIPAAIINGSLKKRLPNNVHLTVPGYDNERLLIGLDEAGILAAAGSACSASREEPSHVLRAMGISDAAARASLRFTMGRATTERDVRRTVAVLAGLIA